MIFNNNLTPTSSFAEFDKYYYVTTFQTVKTNLFPLNS